MVARHELVLCYCVLPKRIARCSGRACSGLFCSGLFCL